MSREPNTGRGIKHLAGRGLKNPQKLTNRQVQQLAGSVEAHIEPRHNGRRRSSRKRSTHRR